MRYVIFNNCHNGAHQGWFYQTRCPKPKPLPPKPRPTPPPVPPKKGPFPKPTPPPRPKPVKPVKPVDPDFGPKPKPPPTITVKIRHTFTWYDMRNWYRHNRKGTSIRWTGRYFPGTKPSFQYMVDYFIRVISRKPSKTRYQWLYKIVQCIIKREPTNNRFLRIWVQSVIRGRKTRNLNLPACVRHLWKGRLSQKPTYHDLASVVRFAFFNQRITYKGLYLFTWSVLNENKPQVISGHTDFWKKYAGVRSQYVSGLEPNRKFLILTGTKKIVLGDRITRFTKLSTNNYWFYDYNNKAIRWLGNYKLRLGVVGGLRNGARVRLVRGNKVRRQDMFVYSSSDMKFHSYVRKDLCITFRSPHRNGNRMTLGRCDCRYGNPTQQELLVKYFRYEKNNGFDPYKVFYLRSVTNRNMAMKISDDGSLLLPSQRYAKVAYGAKNGDEERFYWDP